jgi:rhodanese-related sulfurtransferase
VFYEPGLSICDLTQPKKVNILDNNTQNIAEAAKLTTARRAATLPRKNIIDITKFVFLGALVSVVVLGGGCVGGSAPRPAQLLGGNDQGIINVTPKEASSLIQENLNNPDFVIVDVRPSRYYDTGHIEGAVNIALGIQDTSAFQNKISGLNKNKTYLVYCPDGCGAATRIMKELDFQKLYDITGGYNRWVEEGLPIVE